MALACVAALVTAISAEPHTGSVPGTVVDSRTAKSVRSASVSISSLGIADTTDSTGNFVLDSVPVGFHDLRVQAPAYMTREVPSVQVKSGRNRAITIELEPQQQVRDLGTMVVSAGRVTARTASQSTSMVRLSRDEILTAPGAAQDIAQVLQSMPSVAGAAHEGFTRLLVRGGDEDENVLVVDDIEVNSLSHWGNPYEPGGGVSILHPDYIASVDFYAGGVPVSYPPLLSSATDIQFREGSMEDRTWQVDLNIGGFGAFAEGPIVRNRSSYIINARVGVTYLVSALAGLDGVPEYQNGQAKLAWNLGERDKLLCNLLVGHERLAFDDTQVSGRSSHYNDGTHVAGGVQWRRQMARGANRLLFSGVYHDIVWSDIQMDSIRDSEWRMNRLKLQLKDDLRLFVRERDVLTVGLTAEHESFAESRIVDEYSVWADTTDSTYHYFGSSPDTSSPTLKLLERTSAVDASRDTSGMRVGAHAGYVLFAGPVKVGVGARDDYYTLWRQHAPSVRGSVGFDFRRGGALSLSGGVYRQPLAKFDLFDTFDRLWEHQLQRAYQIALGHELQVWPATILGAEAYYKYYDREPVHRLVYALDPRVSQAGWREVVADPDHYARKRAYGFEVYLQKKKLDRFYYQLSYSLSTAEQEYEGGAWRPDDNSLRNRGSVVLGSNINRNHRLSMRFDVSEGYPYTPLDMPASGMLGTTVYDLSDSWNAHRRPAHFKLNLRYDLSLYLRRTNVVLYLEGYNLLNQRDIVYEYFDYGERWPQGTRVQVLSRSILPGLGLYVTF